MKRLLELIKVRSRFMSTTRTKMWNDDKRIGSLKPKNKLSSFVNRLRWPLTFALTIILLGHWRKNRMKKQQIGLEDGFTPYQPHPLEISFIKIVPFRTISRLWGWVNSIDLPESARLPILKIYAKTFGCNLEEASEDLQQYKNLDEFFRRELRPGLRPIEGNDDDIVSPCDGTIQNLGLAEDGLLEQVKGLTYTIESFLGPNTWKPQPSYSDEMEPDYQKSLLHNPNNDLYYYVIYLAPGDYHRFHSPVNWTVQYRRHFPGKLLPVRPTFASWFPDLYSINERVAYIGEWKYGFFAMAPVGATNVGSMKIYFDPELRTNRLKKPLEKLDLFEDKKINNVHLKKGDPFGEFNLGSTIVLIFEAPKNIELKCNPSMKVKYGQLMSSFSLNNN